MPRKAANPDPPRSQKGEVSKSLPRNPRSLMGSRRLPQTPLSGCACVYMQCMFMPLRVCACTHPCVHICVCLPALQVTEYPR